MNTLTTAVSAAEETARSLDTRPREITKIRIDPVGCENEFEVKEGMTRADALEIAFRIVWCQKIGKKKRKLTPQGLLDLVVAINRLPESAQDPVTVGSLLEKARLFQSESYLKEMEQEALVLSQGQIAFTEHKALSMLAAAG